MKRIIQRFVIKIYEKLGCRYMDTSDFWHYHLLYSVPKETNGKIIIAEINRITTEIEAIGEWNPIEGLKEWR